MERIGTLLVAPSAERTAEPGRFGAALKGAASELAGGLASSVALAAPYVPGGPVLAGALRTVSRPLLASAQAALLPGTASAGAAGASFGAPASATGITGGDADLLTATRLLQQESQSFNLQYLQLQESLQRESREFTALSNALKVRHDTAKAAIGNIH